MNAAATTLSYRNATVTAHVCGHIALAPVYFVKLAKGSMLAGKRNGCAFARVLGADSKNGPDLDQLGAITWSDDAHGHAARAWALAECEKVANDTSLTPTARNLYAVQAAALRG